MEIELLAPKIRLFAGFCTILATKSMSYSTFSTRNVTWSYLKIFDEKTYNLKKNFKVTIPNKWHYTIEHVNEYIEKTNLSLGRTSDQLIVSSHQHTINIFSRSLDPVYGQGS